MHTINKANISFWIVANLFWSCRRPLLLLTVVDVLVPLKTEGCCQSLEVWLIFFLFLQTKPIYSTLFAWSQLDISATSDSVSAVSEGYQLNYPWILTLLSGLKIFKLLNLCGNQLIRIPYGCLYLCSFCFWGKYSNRWIWYDIGRNCLLGHRKKIAKFLMRTFLLAALPSSMVDILNIR